MFGINQVFNNILKNNHSSLNKHSKIPCNCCLESSCKPDTLCSIWRFSSVQSLSRVWLLWPHEPQHTRTPCPLPTPRVYTNPCSLRQCCHPAISSSVIHFSSCPQSFPASGSFPVSWIFSSGGQSIGTSALASVLPMNIQGWVPLRLTGLISLQSNGPSRVFSNPTVQSINFSALSFLHSLTLTSLYDRWKNYSFDYMDLCWQSDIFMFFSMLSRFVITFLTKSMCLWISWLQSPCAVILEPKKIKSVTISVVSPSICHEVMRLDAMILAFWMLSFKLAFSSPLSRLARGSLVLLHFLPLEWYYLHIWGCYFSCQSSLQLMIHPACPFIWCTLHVS